MLLEDGFARTTNAYSRALYKKCGDLDELKHPAVYAFRGRR